MSPGDGVGVTKLLGDMFEDKFAMINGMDFYLPEGLNLIETSEGLTLSGGGLSLRADFRESLPRITKGRVNSEMVVKASRIKDKTELRALDATAGLGEDAILLAAAGFTVDMYEYDPVIFLLLKDAWERALSDRDLHEVASRMQLHHEDSIAAMNTLDGHYDVVLLDPMFPKREKSGLIKKKFQLLQQLETPCSNESELLDAALKLSPHKIVIKRPAKGPYLAGRKPSYQLNGKAIRYDCIVLA